jgi:hypothetical protein
MLISAIILTVNIFTWDNKYLTITTLIFFIGTFFAKLFRSFVIKDFTIIGEMIFGDEVVEIKIYAITNLNIKLSELKEISIIYFGYEGESYNYSRSLNDFNQKQGNQNKITFLSDNNENKYEFFLENWSQCLILFRWLRYFESRGKAINFKNQFGDNMLYKK